MNYFIFQASAICTFVLTGANRYPFLSIIWLILLFARFFRYQEIIPREQPKTFSMAIILFLVISWIGNVSLYPLLMISESSVNRWVFILGYHYANFWSNYIYWTILWTIFEFVFYFMKPKDIHKIE